MILPSLWPISLITRLPTTRKRHHPFDCHCIDDELPSIFSHDLYEKHAKRIEIISRGNGTQRMRINGGTWK